MQPPDDIKIKITQNQQEIHIPENIRTELEEICRRKLKEQQQELQNNVYKAEIINHKIHRIFPKNSFIPQTMLSLIKEKSVFDQLAIFLDTCYGIQKKTSTWKPENVDFNHKIFCNLSLIHKELTEKIVQHSKDDCNEVYDLIKEILEQAYMPSHIKLLIYEAQKITKHTGFEFSQDLENHLTRELTNIEKFQNVKNYIDCCKLALEMKKKGQEKSQDFLTQINKIKTRIFPLFYYYFPKDEEKNSLVIILAKKLLKIVETPAQKRYFSFIWSEH